MSYALSSGVTGLQAHQKMLDVAGNNLANVNTTSFKASRIGFAELLSQTLSQASQPTDQVGGTNPQQMGSGVGVVSITPNMTQGSIVNTGNPLDVAIEGEGYFVVNNGEQQLYTRAGAFGVDESGSLVDPATGYRVQRIGLTGEADGFQIPGDSSIRIPYDVALPATATSEVKFTGNLSSDAVGSARAQSLVSTVVYTVNEGTDALDTTQLDQLDQFSGGSGTGGQLGAGQTGTITFSGYNKDGSDLSSGLTFTVTGTTTIADLIDHLNNNVLTDSTASFVNGRIQITDNETGYSRTDLSMSYSGSGSLEMPAYFEMTSVGGNESKATNIAVYDTQGGKHVLSAALVRTDEINTWDIVLTSMSGNVLRLSPENRRVNGLQFDPQSGAFMGVPQGEATEFVVSFTHDVAHPQTISLDFGTAGSFDGLTQFAGNSTAVAREQDGYEAGNLSAVSVSSEGVLIGAFTNGVKKDLATLAVGLFRNAAGLERVGNGYFAPSANSGGAVITQAGSTGAGAIHGSALEKSNADVATEFVSLIEAQNGFQANARTITVANDILRELTSLIR
ncbi:MAG: flagellar hook-basal body complex protein [Planctomycetes bacterium]|nr:flagellar hook-basal body complex protein [Planctomycetota bacterium]